MRRRNEGWIEAFGDNSWSVGRDSNGGPSRYYAVILWSPPQSFVHSTLLCSSTCFRKWRNSESKQIINASSPVWLKKDHQNKKVIRIFGKRMNHQLRLRMVSVTVHCALCVLSASIRFRCIAKTEWDAENFHMYLLSITQLSSV